MYVWLSGLSWTLLYINNIQRMLNKYLTRFMLEFLEFMAIDKPKEGSAVRVRLPMMAAYNIRGSSARKGYLFQASGI